jgi:autotransporter-associated beta strand protein
MTNQPLTNNIMKKQNIIQHLRNHLSHLAVAGCIVLALAPMAPAANLYTENFIGTLPAVNLGVQVGNSPVGWTSNNWSAGVGDSRVMTLHPLGGTVDWGAPAGSVTPDGDFWYVVRGTGDSGRQTVTSKAGEYTITSASRIDTTFTVDWASGTTKGARLIAKVGTKWYASAKFGTGTDHGAQSAAKVTSWATKSYNVDSGTWYEWTTPWEESGLSSTPLTGVPAGNITEFGMWWGVTGNGDTYAIDNFRVDATPASGTYVWDGGTGNWAAANWSFGGSPGQSPATGFHMYLDAAGGSTVAVNADFSSALSVNVGQTNTAALTVNSAMTLGATLVNVGSTGTLQVDGTLTAPAVVTNGTVAVSNTGIVNASSLIQILAGSLTSSSTGALNVGTGTLQLAGGTGATLDGPLSITGGTIILNSGTLTYNNATAADPAVLVFSGGALAGTGSVVPTVRYEANNVSISNNLTGTTAGLTAVTGIVTLTGTNNYGGNTEIKAFTGRTTLRVADVTYLNANTGGGYLYFNSPTFYQNGASNRPATLETTGTLTRTIGTAAGGISFTGITGDGNPAAAFAAYGGPLVIDLNGGGGATIAWDGAAGLNGSDLMFGSANANDVVTVKNGLNMTTANRTINVTDNAGSSADWAVIEGVITNDATARQLTKSGTGKLILTNSNTYTGITNVSAGTLEVSSPGNLGLSTSLTDALTIGSATVRLLNDSSTDFVKSVKVNGTAGIYVDRAGVSASGNTHTLGALWINGNRTMTITGGNGYGLTFGAAKADDSATITNNAPGMLTLASLNETSFSAKTITIRGTGNTTIAGAVTQGVAALSLTKDDAGTLTLNGGGSYLGTTLVNNGKLFVNGDQTLATGNVTVNGGKTLGGTGTIGGNVTINATARLAFNLITPYTSHDHLALAATKTMTFGASVNIDITGGGTAGPGDYVLVAGVSGTEPTYNVTLPALWTADAPRFVGTDLKINITSTGVAGYASWAGAGVNAFDADANNDGVANGMAWVLGALNKEANAISLLPTLDNTNATYFIFTYNRKDDANTDPNTIIKVEYCSDLATWTEAVHDGTNIIITPTDNGAIDSVQVKIIRTLAVGNKLFARLNVQKAP